MADTFDVIVIGDGPGGENAASRLCAGGMRTALLERELIGGECAYWACIPSKTLLRAVEIGSEARRTAGTAPPAQDWPAIASYRDFMIRDRDDTEEVKSYARRGVTVIKGEASLIEPGRDRVGDEVVDGALVIIATGSEPVVPEIPGLATAGYWTNREATTIREVPDSVCVVGGPDRGADRHDPAVPYLHRGLHEGPRRSRAQLNRRPGLARRPPAVAM
jgi:dihydrolipoamide dehydrogenase